MILEPGLIDRKLGDIRFRLVAAPSFLEKAGRPRSLKDLNGSPFLAYTQVARDGKVRLQTEDGAEDIRFAPVLLSSNESLLMHAAIEGMGFGFMPNWLVDADLASQTAGARASCSRQSLSNTLRILLRSELSGRKVRSFLDFLVEAEFPNRSANG